MSGEQKACNFSNQNHFYLNISETEKILSPRYVMTGNDKFFKINDDGVNGNLNFFILAVCMENKILSVL